MGDLLSDTLMKLKFFKENEFNCANLSGSIKLNARISDFSNKFYEQGGVFPRFSGKM
jgi:hypothetical protein